MYVSLANLNHRNTCTCNISVIFTTQLQQLHTVASYLCADTEMRVVQVDTMIVMMTTTATYRGPGAGVAGVCGLLLGLGLVQPHPLAVLRPARLLHRAQLGGQGAECPGGQVTSGHTALLPCPRQDDLAASPATGRARARPTSPGPWMARPWRLPRTAAR